MKSHTTPLKTLAAAAGLAAAAVLCLLALTGRVRPAPPSRSPTSASTRW